MGEGGGFETACLPPPRPLYVGTTTLINPRVFNTFRPNLTEIVATHGEVSRKKQREIMSYLAGWRKYYCVNGVVVE